MREELKTNYTEIVWNIRETDIESGKEREWNIHKRAIEYEYTAPAGSALPSPEYQRASLPSVQQLGIAQVASAPATLQQPRKALKE